MMPSIMASAVVEYGISLTSMMRALVSTVYFARKVTEPLPVRYISAIASVSRRSMPPVVKSGPGMTSAMSFFGCWILMMVASHSSMRLKLGIDDAIPTAIPSVGFARMFGNVTGKSTGSLRVES